jgi:hypothetical protein
MILTTSYDLRSRRRCCATSSRHALELSPDRFHSDTRHLVSALDRTLAGNQDNMMSEDHGGVAAETPVRDQVQRASTNLPLPSPPPWLTGSSRDRTLMYQATAEAEQRIDASIRLRRPLLVTGAPGTGKSSLAYSVAENYGLGSVLRWRIRRRSNLREGLYHYDEAARSEAMRLLDSDERLGNPSRTGLDIGAFVSPRTAWHGVAAADPTPGSARRGSGQER